MTPCSSKYTAAISSRFSPCSEANALELRENLKEIIHEKVKFFYLVSVFSQRKI